MSFTFRLGTGNNVDGMGNKIKSISGDYRKNWVSPALGLLSLTPGLKNTY